MCVCIIYLIYMKFCIYIYVTHFPSLPINPLFTGVPQARAEHRRGGHPQDHRQRRRPHRPLLRLPDLGGGGAGTNYMYIYIYIYIYIYNYIVQIQYNINSTHTHIYTPRPPSAPPRRRPSATSPTASASSSSWAAARASSPCTPP